MSIISNYASKIDAVIFNSPRIVLGLIFGLTIFFATQIPAVRMYSDFADELPKSHPYIQLHNGIKGNFSGAKVINVGVEVVEGDIINNETLRLRHDITQAVDSLTGVNHNLVASLTHRTTRKVWLTEMGNINSEPYFKPQSPAMSESQFKSLRKDIIANLRFYGPLVSPEMKTTLIKAKLKEGAWDYE